MVLESKQHNMDNDGNLFPHPFSELDGTSFARITKNESEANEI